MSRNASAFRRRCAPEMSLKKDPRSCFVDTNKNLEWAIGHIGALHRHTEQAETFGLGTVPTPSEYQRAQRRNMLQRADLSSKGADRYLSMQDEAVSRIERWGKEGP